VPGETTQPMSSDLVSLAKLLDTDPAAERLTDDMPVWRVRWRGTDVLRRMRGQPERDADALLTAALDALPRVGRPCFLVCDPEVDVHDLGPGAWIPVSPETWQVAASTERQWLVERGYLGQIGGYALYVRLEPLPDGEYARGLGTARTADDFVEGVRRLSIEALIAVGPDATEWFAVLPNAAAT
jgi:hypothetical protein